MHHLRQILLLAGLVLISTFSTARNVNIREFGAIGNGEFLNTAAFRNAIDTCHFTGGGTVTIPQGIYKTGTIVLRSNVNLHLEIESAIKKVYGTVQNAEVVDADETKLLSPSNP